MAENAVYLLMTALIRNFYKTIIRKLNVKDFGLSISSRIKTFVFKYISVAAKWIRTSRTYVLNIYTENPAYKNSLSTGFWLILILMVGNAYCLKSLHGVRGSYAKEWTFGTFVSLKHNVKIINSLKNAWQSLISFACGN